MQKYLDLLNSGNADQIKLKLDVLKVQEDALNLLFENTDYVSKNGDNLQLAFRMVNDEIVELENLLISIARDKNRKGVCANSLSLVINNID